MAFLPRRTTGPRAWWFDVVMSVAAVGTAQAIVLGGDTLLEVVGRRPAPTTGFEAALVLERAHGGDGETLVGLEPLALALEGAVSGLYPGATGELPLVVTNSTQATVTLERLTITVGDPDRPGCPADAIVVGSPATRGTGSTDLALSIDPDRTVVVRVPVGMVPGAPEACQGATFPLRYLAEGALG
jgi:hypothetical protein